MGIWGLEDLRGFGDLRIWGLDDLRIQELGESGILGFRDFVIWEFGCWALPSHQEPAAQGIPNPWKNPQIPLDVTLGDTFIALDWLIPNLLKIPGFSRIVFQDPKPTPWEHSRICG